MSGKPTIQGFRLANLIRTYPDADPAQRRDIDRVIARMEEVLVATQDPKPAVLEFYRKISRVEPGQTIEIPYVLVKEGITFVPAEKPSRWISCSWPEALAAMARGHTAKCDGFIYRFDPDRGIPTLQTPSPSGWKTVERLSKRLYKLDWYASIEESADA